MAADVAGAALQRASTERLAGAAENAAKGASEPHWKSTKISYNFGEKPTWHYALIKLYHSEVMYEDC